MTLNSDHVPNPIQRNFVVGLQAGSFIMTFQYAGSYPYGTLAHMGD